MKNQLYLWQFIGFIFTGIVGTFLHFIYKWSNQNVIIAPISAVNESIWEHMKLLFFPMFFFAFVESIILEEQYDNYWCSKLVGIVSGLILIPVLYYTYTGMFGVSLDWVNIIIFFISAAVTYILETRLLSQENIWCISQRDSLMILYLISLAFMVFTFMPPHIPLFQDPITGGFGI